MNKRIYFNNDFIEFTRLMPKEGVMNLTPKFLANSGIRNFAQSSGISFLTGKNENCLFVSEKDMEKTLEFLKEKFYYIVACGGIIEKDGKFLLIERLGKWDLPKGKREKGETSEQCAVRECEEECGINKLEIISPLPSTFHVYPYEKTYAFKESCWFYMKCSDDRELKPQMEENITHAVWMEKRNVEDMVYANTYPAIRDLLQDFFSSHRK